MATQPKVGTTTCDDTENNDGDHFYCIGKTGASTDLSQHLQGRRRTQLAKGKSHLVNLYPIPVVTAVSPSSGSHNGGTTVTISGVVLHRGDRRSRSMATSVPFTVVNDTTITATAPSGGDRHDGRHLGDDTGRDLHARSARDRFTYT